MKTKYLFIYAPNGITHETVLYTVMIGNSKADNNILRFLQSLSFNNDYYFRKYDNEVAEFVGKIKAQFLPPGRFISDVPHRVTVSASELKQAVLAGNFSHKPLPKGYSYTTAQVDLDFRFNLLKQICHERK